MGAFSIVGGFPVLKILSKERDFLLHTCYGDWDSICLQVPSIVCVVGTLVGFMFAGGSIVSIANMTVPWSGMLIIAALLVPSAFAVSGIGAWLAYGWGFTQFAIGLVAFPWLYAIIFIFLMIVSFNR
jgi:hypothetical protein